MPQSFSLPCGSRQRTFETMAATLFLCDFCTASFVNSLKLDIGLCALRDRARGAMDELRFTFRRIISKGIEQGEVRPGVDVETWTSTMIFDS